MLRNTADRRAAVALGVLIALLFARALFLGEVFYERDLGLLWYAQTEAFVHAVAGGSWPLWNPHVAFGQPMLANANYQILYPLTWLNLMLRPETWFVVFAVFHAGLAAAGQYRVGRRLDLSPPSACLAAAVFVASGPFLSMLNVWNHYAAAAYLPWAFLAVLAAVDAPSARHAFLWAVPLALQILAGSPDIVVFTGLLTAARLLSHVTWRAPGALTNRRLAGTAALALAATLGLSAAQWLPTADALRQSPRREAPAELAAGGALHPIAGVAKLFSATPLADLPIRRERAAPVLDGGMVLLRLPYLGLAAAGLVLAGLIGPPRRHRVFLAVAGAVAFLYALGPHAPVQRIAAALAPALLSLRYPSKALLVTAFAWALLAGMGLEHWRDEGGRGRLWSLGVTVPAAALALAAFAGATVLAWPRWIAPYLVPQEEVGRPWSDALNGPALRLAFAGLLASTLVVLSIVRRRGPRGAAVAALIVVVDLWAAGRDANRTVDRSFYRIRPALVEHMDRADLSRVFVYRYDPWTPLGGVANPYTISWYPAGLDIDGGRLLGARLYPLPQAGGAWGLFGSYDPDIASLYPAPLTAAVRAAYDAFGTPVFRRYLEIGAVRQAVGLDPRGFEDLQLVTELKTPLVLTARLYRVPAPLPRTYVVASAWPADDVQARARIEDLAFDPRGQVIVPPGDVPAAQAPPAVAGSSRVAVFKADSVRLEVEASRPGYVVLVDTWDAGWKARVDGKPAPILRANLTFRAVHVEAGRHVIEMSYRPVLPLIGLGLSGATAAALVVTLRGRRPKPD